MAEDAAGTPNGQTSQGDDNPNSTTLVWAKIWDVSAPPPNNTLKGHMMPMFLTRRHRRVSIEVHRIMIGDPKKRKNKSADQLQEGTDYYEECIVRILSPPKKNKNLLGLKSSSDTGDAATVDSGDDDDSVAEAAFADEGIEDTPDYAGWTAKYRLPLETITIKKVHRKTVDIVVHYQSIKQTRDVIFHSEEEAKEFAQMIDVQKQAGERRGAAKVKAALGSTITKVDTKKELTLLIEIVSGWDLPAADLTSSDPYVVAFMRGFEVHRTKHIPKTLDPIWTVKTGSLFLLTLTVEELFTSNGLICEVMDFDKFGGNDKLGLITVPPKVLYDAKGERLEFNLVSTRNSMEASGGIAIRCRRATDYDIQFMNDFDANKSYKKQKLTVHEMMEKADKAKGGKGGLHSVVSHNVKTERHGPNKGKTVYRIRPGPDPTRKEETTWMTEEQIDAEVVKDSMNWLDTGSGKLGRIYLEVLECSGLPNLDTGGFLGNKTDTFVCAIFEDTIVKTDVIDDSLSPRWLPWSNRAFIFHMMNSSSPLYLGVFDFDPGYDDHDLIGRVAIDLCNMRKDTTYVLKYDIYPTAKLTDRVKQGTLKIRLRLEIDDERQLLLSALEPPPTVYVNVKTRKDWALVRYTCQGKVDTDAYSMKVINSYVEELLSYQHLIYYLQDAVISLLLWRGHFSCTIAGYDLLLPLHSLNAFITLAYLVEHPRLAPSFFFLCIGWLLIAVMGWRRRSPDPWSRCKPYRAFFETLARGSSMLPPDSIESFENAEEAAKFQEKMQKRIIDAEEAARVAYEQQQKEQEEEMAEMEGIGGDTDISTKQGSGIVSSIDVFKPFLYPIQQYLDLTVGYVRIIRNVVVWEEAYMSFWITTGCFVLAVVFYFLPWVFLLQWTARILVWVVFGPWMKAVDVFYYSKLKPPTEEELEKQKLKAEKLRMLRRKEHVREARIQKENAAKLKAMKKIMFGRFVTKVPVIKQDRHQDFPLAESSATPYETKPHTLAELAMKEAGYHRTRLPGQHLVGDMIPRMESSTFTDAGTGQATKDPSKLDPKSPGANPSKDSDVAAYAKLGAMVGAAGLVSWFVVPLLSAVVQRFLG